LVVADRAGTARPLIDVASIRSLERRLEDAGQDVRQLWETPQDWTQLEDHVAPWIAETAHALAAASVAASAVIDFEAVVIDGGMPENIRLRLVAQASEDIRGMDTRGLITPTLVEGQIGGNARGIGAAVGPIINQYLLDRPATLFEQA
ncbi:MAG: sugar kinase, partial [Pseudomonadota bacterium]